MAKKRKKVKKPEEHPSEAWLVPYADILTLLLALFIVLFASSTVDQKKWAQMSNVFNNIFTSGTGFFDNASIVESPAGSTDEINSQLSKYLQDQASLQAIQSRVEDFIAVNELEDQFETELTGEGLLITIRDSVLFDSGKADVKAEYRDMAIELSKVLMLDPNRNVIIAGHTDNVPMNNAEFRSNWHLSVMRAVNFLNLIIENNSELDPKHFSAKGYGEYNPIASNDTAEGRAKNRRVEVLIQPNVAEDGSAYNPKE